MSFEDGTNLAARAVLFFSARTRNGGVAVRAAVVATATATMHASNVTFYQYEGRALDHGWLHNCAGFHALRHGASDRFLAEVAEHCLPNLLPELAAENGWNRTALPAAPRLPASCGRAAAIAKKLATS